MGTSTRKNYRNSDQHTSDIDQVEAESALLPREENFSRFARGIRWIPRWISFKQKKKVVSLIVLIAIAAGTYGVYEKFFNLSDAERAQKELAATVATVEELMVLPEGDEPVLATVTDAEALIKQQAFFAGAVNGDQLLLFPRNLKAVIYSPSRNKIVNAGPIEQQPTQSQAATWNDHAFAGLPAEALAQAGTSADKQETLTVEVRNGTDKSGLAAQVAENLRAAGFNVVVVADAKDKNYAKTILAMNTKSAEKKKLATPLIAQLEAELMDKIPEGEKNTDADALIIIGGE